MQLLRKKCEELTQAEVARRLGYSASAVNQVLKGEYRGDPAQLLTRVEEVFGSTVVNCPVCGDISLGKCAANRRLPFASINPMRVRLWRECRNCEQEGTI
jgi:transcriptional regulator with XRE-family HTH domain